MTSQMLLKRACAFLSDESGAAMVEFSIASGVFLMMLFGIAEFANTSWQRNCVESDAREGSRYAIVRGANSGRAATPDSVKAFVRAHTLLDPLGLRVYVTWSPDKRPGSAVSVSVAHTVARGLLVRSHVDSATSMMTITN